MGQSHDPIVYDTMRHYAPWMDLAVMVSKTMKQKAEAMPEFAGVPVACLPYGVPMCPDAGLPARDFTAPLRLLYLGRLENEQKRVRLFPQMLEQLKASGIPFHWTIAGDGPEKMALEQAMRGSPNQTVSFPGKISYAVVPEILRAHDIFLLASDYEGLPLSLLEAMGAGLVPVVSELPAGDSGDGGQNHRHSGAGGQRGGLRAGRHSFAWPSGRTGRQIRRRARAGANGIFRARDDRPLAGGNSQNFSGGGRMAGALDHPSAAAGAPSGLFFAAGAGHAEAGDEIPALGAAGFCASTVQPSVWTSWFKCRSHQRKKRLMSQLTGRAAMGCVCWMACPMNA